MEDKVCSYMGLCMGEIVCHSRWEPGSAGMATPCVLFTQSSKSITCFFNALHMKGAHVVLADQRFLEFG